MAKTEKPQDMIKRPTDRPCLPLCVVLLLALTGAGEAIGADGADAQAPPSWSAQLRSTAYFLEQAEPGESEVQARLPFYEHFNAHAGGLLDDRLDLRFSGRYASDAQFDGGVAEEGKWFVGYARLRLEPWQMQLRAGRQFIQEGTVFATIDGGWVSLRPVPRLGLSAWGGVTSPSARQFEFGDDFRAGGRASYMFSRGLRLSAWGENRSRDGRTLAIPVGGELLARPIPTLRTLVRGAWDLQSEEFERADLMLNWRHRRSWPTVQAHYLIRTQAYESGSWWEQFSEDLHDVQLLRGSVRWTNAKGIGGELRGFSSFVDERKETQIGAAFLAPHLRAGLALLDGDAGEQLRFYGDVNWTFAERLDTAAGVSFTNYALVPDPTSDQERDLTSMFARAGYRIAPGAELMTELQYLDNPFYKSDVRVLVGLDLMAGRGASRLGFGSGGGER